MTRCEGHGCNATAWVLRVGQVRPAGIAPLKRGQGPGGGRGAPKPAPSPSEQAAAGGAMSPRAAGAISPRRGGGRDGPDPDAPAVQSAAQSRALPAHHLHCNRFHIRARHRSESRLTNAAQLQSQASTRCRWRVLWRPPAVFTLFTQYVHVLTGSFLAVQGWPDLPQPEAISSALAAPAEPLVPCLGEFLVK